jgi:SAM-dependent methyltransferase
MLDALATERILERYPHASAFQRWHMRGRLRLCPYERLERHLTGRGNLLDVGCGFGHLAWHLTAVKPGLRYFGTDVDARKIALAKGCRSNASQPPDFRLGDAMTLSGLPETFGNIVFLDVLYLMPWEAQQRMLAWALGRLSPGSGSAVVIKTMDKAEGVSGFRAVAEEWIMVSLLRRTLSSGALNGARATGDYLDFARSLGFHAEAEALGTFNPSTIIRMNRLP